MLTKHSTRLICGTLRGVATEKFASPHKIEPVRRDLRPSAMQELVRESLDDGRSIGERTVDVVVDRLLKELTW